MSGRTSDDLSDYWLSRDFPPKLARVLMAGVVSCLIRSPGDLSVILISGRVEGFCLMCESEWVTMRKKPTGDRFGSHCVIVGSL